MKLEYLIPSLAILSLIGLLLSTLASGQVERAIEVNATVSKYISITPSPLYTSVDFGTVTHGTSNNRPINYNQTAGEAYINVTTNYDYEVSAKVSTVIEGLTHKLNVDLALENADNPNYAKTLTGTYKLIHGVGIYRGGTYTEYHGNFLDVGEPKAGTYSWTLYLLYENAV